MNGHPLADLIPEMTEDDYHRLRDDIAENGLQQPIVTYEDQILDGRHRFRACQETGRTPQFTAYEGEAPARFVLSVNISRRHLTTSQLAMVAVEFLPVLEREAKDRQRAAGKDHGRGTDSLASVDAKLSRAPRSAEMAANAVGVGSATVERAKRVSRDAPDLAEQIKAGSMTVDKAVNTLKQRETDEPAPSNGNGRRQGQPLPVDSLAAMTERNRNFANKARQRIHNAIAGLGGYADGLVELNLTNLRHLTHEDEVRHWHDQIRHVTHQLRAFDRALKEAQL